MSLAPPPLSAWRDMPAVWRRWFQELFARVGGSSINGVADLTLAPNASPAFTGTPTAPTAAAGTSSTQIATTAFVAGLSPGISARSFNAAGNGVTDDTTALANWVAAMPADRAHMTLPPGTYITTAALAVSGKSNFRIDGKGATIKYANGTAVSSGKYLLDFVSCTDGVIEGLTLDGNRANRTPAEVPAHSLNVYTSCARLTFRDVRSINAVVDGFYVATGTPAVEASYPADIVFEDCESDNAWRNGMSIIAAARPTVRGGDYSGSAGANPEAGIDIEPDVGTTYTVKDAVIEGARFRNNGGRGLMISGANMTVANVRTIARDLKFSNNGLGAVIVGPSTAPLLDGITVEDHPATVTRGLIDVNANASTGVVIRNVEIRDATTANGAGHYGVYVHASVAGPVQLDNIRLRNVAAGGAGVYLATQAFASGIRMDTVTGPGLVMTAANSRASDVVLKATGGITFQITGADSEVDGATLIDPTGTNTAVYFSGARPRARNISVIQTTSIPVGQKAIQFVAVTPLVAQNLIARSAGTDYTASNGIVFGSGIGTTALTAAGRFVSTVSADRGDADQTLTVGDAQIQRWATALTANRTVTLSTTGAIAGDWFRVVRTGLGAFTLDVGGLKTIPNATAAFVDVTYNGSAWVLTGYGTL